MGGKAMALHGVQTERKSTEDHLRIQSELVPVIAEMFKTEVKTVLFYRTKDSHGDLDLLVLNNGNLGNINNKLKERFGVMNNNGGVCFSFAYDNYQVDVIPISKESWMCTDFFNYDPSGNLCGKIAHKFGAKFGNNGLEYPFRNFSGRLSKDLVITKDHRKALEFLGFDYERYAQGFDTVEEIFEWVISSKYFNLEIFQIEALGHKDRLRQRKRDTYNKFLEYIAAKNLTNPWVFEKDKSVYLDKIEEAFPESKLKEKLAKLKEEDDLNKLSSEKFNGSLVMEWTGLQGKELGNCLSDFRSEVCSSIGEIRFRDFILNFEDDADIRTYFDGWYSLNKERYDNSSR